MTSTPSYRSPPTAATVVVRGLILAYRYLLSPVLPGACRYQPSCSAYGLEAVSRYGAGRGGWLALRRIARCHPWGGYGYDPVPSIPHGSTTARSSAAGSSTAGSTTARSTTAAGRAGPLDSSPAS